LKLLDDLTDAFFRIKNEGGNFWAFLTKNLALCSFISSLIAEQKISSKDQTCTRLTKTMSSGDYPLFRSYLFSR